MFFDENYSSLESLLLTGRLTKQYELAGNVLELQTLTPTELKRVDFVKKDHHRYLFYILRYSLKSLNFSELTPDESEDLISGCQFEVFRKLGDLYNDLVDELDKTISLFSNYKKTDRSYNKFLVLKNLSSPVDLVNAHDIQWNWIHYNYLIYDRLKRDVAEDQSYYISSSMNGEFGKALYNDLSNRRKQFYASMGLTDDIDQSPRSNKSKNNLQENLKTDVVKENGMEITKSNRYSNTFIEELYKEASPEERLELAKLVPELLEYSEDQYSEEPEYMGDESGLDDSEAMSRMHAEDLELLEAYNFPIDLNEDY